MRITISNGLMERLKAMMKETSTESPEALAVQLIEKGVSDHEGHKILRRRSGIPDDWSPADAKR